MTYVFDPASSATRAQLAEMVWGNTFSSTRYAEFISAWLNDGVLDICRRLRIHRSYAILDVAAGGLVTQPASPFYHVEALWTATGATGTGEAAFGAQVQTRLEPLPQPSTAGYTGSTPIVYTARRVTHPTQRYTGLQITVIPQVAAGKVGIVGLTRPPVMDTDDDVSGLGADLDDALIAFAKARAFRQEDDFEMSNAWKVEYEGSLRSALFVPEINEGPITTPGSWDDGYADGGR